MRWRALHSNVFTQARSEVWQQIARAVAAGRILRITSATGSRELRPLEQYPLAPARLEAVGAPTLLLVGGGSPVLFKAGIEAVYAALPNSRIVALPGQQHIAMDTAPDLFVREVTAFLSEPG